MTDQVENFIKVSVDGTYTTADLTVTLVTGHGSELPDPTGDPYNMVWWDATHYGDPADDPNVEIVRVTAKSSDTLTVTRNQEGSGASVKNTLNAVYKMVLGLTAKTITDLQSDLTTHAQNPLAHINVLTKTADYTIPTSDFNSSIRMNSADDKILTLPSVAEASDGARLTLIKLGAGKVTIQAADSDIIADGSAGGTIYDDESTETYASITLEYVHGSISWVIISGFGVWNTT